MLLFLGIDAFCQGSLLDELNFISDSSTTENIDTTGKNLKEKKRWFMVLLLEIEL